MSSNLHFTHRSEKLSFDTEMFSFVQLFKELLFLDGLHHRFTKKITEGERERERERDRQRER